ncbi:cytokinesis protein cyk3 (variant SH3 domain-containing protein) [Phlyctema vagabunda]|uniref:Cytokinesis protein cyk3 (Variant SH3 domain-containing protein) n=1 Tax=Phlyctema vagabunda TaxID=108571 RepID=A0ABR4PIK7_9HELO
MEAPGLPTRFPCWVRAVYSWGGESKRDLGFMEGDLIECLNAGDGSWWMGRLRRDKRMMGLFPSNFVTVLDDSFRPASRASSPLPNRSPSPSPLSPQSPQKSKTKASRRPFQSYGQPDLAAQKRAEIRNQESLSKSSGPAPAPRSVHDNIQSVPPPRINGYGSRAASPAPPLDYRPRSRGPSPSPYHQNDVGSSPPPPPPPHRSTYTPHAQSNSYTRNNALNTPRGPSPCPPSPGGGSGLTPSPLRTAMEDVMSSLQDMGLSRDTTGSPAPPVDPWSPEAFDQTYITAKRKAPPRPNTAIGIGGPNDEYEDYGVPSAFADPVQSRYMHDQPPPQLSNYVERMETRLNKMHKTSPRASENDEVRPTVPPKMSSYIERPKSSMGAGESQIPKLRHRKSAYDMGRSVLGRTFTTKTNSTSSSSGGRSTTTNGSSSTQMTDRSLMSGASAGAFSSTSAGSLARKKEELRGRAQSAMGTRKTDFNNSSVDLSLTRPHTPLTTYSYHGSHASNPPRTQSQAGWHGASADSGLGGLMAPKPKKSGFFKKIIESAKTGAASARSNISAGDATRPTLPTKTSMPNGITSLSGGFGSNTSRDPASEMGLGGSNSGIDWVQVRRDVNRSNSLSRIERVERKERCQMMDHPAISPVDELFETTDGDEGSDGTPVLEPMNFQAVNLSLVDKNARFINSLPPMTNPVSLATGFVCRPYRSDVQRLRAIFTWVSEKIAWEEDFESDVDPRRVISTKRGSAEEVAVLVTEMCAAVGIHAEIIRGYLKTPGEVPELGFMPRANHWWNGVVVDGEWRMMDCSLASPSNPRRQLYSSAGSQTAESWWFLARPTEICWTHVAEQHHQQHICPPLAHEVLLALPCACPPYFKNELSMTEYDTSLVRVEDLELVHVKFTVPADIECVAEVEARAFERDQDGDFFESGEVIRKRALAQAEWIGGQKRYTVKALLPGDEGQGILKIYAGKRGLMQSIKDIPHPLAFALPIIHTGDNPPYEFLTRHPTPHAQRHDLYVAQPQCQRLAVNNTFVFAVRQHPSSLAAASPNPGGTSPIPFIRPTSAMSLTSSSASGSNPSTSNAYSTKKPAKLAIQSPGGKILRLMRKEDKTHSTSQPVEVGDGGTWETIIKCGEKGVWRGLVLADRSARWCVFAEWTCV